MSYGERERERRQRERETRERERERGCRFMEIMKIQMFFQDV